MSTYSRIITQDIKHIQWRLKKEREKKKNLIGLHTLVESSWIWMSFNAQVLYLNQNKRKQEVKFDHEKLDECMCYIVKFNRQIHAHIWHLLVLSEPGIQFKCFSMRSFNWVRQYWTTTIFFFFPYHQIETLISSIPGTVTFFFYFLYCFLIKSSFFFSFFYYFFFFVIISIY